MSEITLFNFELEDARACLRMISASEPPIRALFDVDDTFEWKGWHHENSPPDEAPGQAFYGIWGLYYESTPGEPSREDRDEQEDSLFRRGILVCAVRFPRASTGSFFRFLEVSAVLQQKLAEFEGQTHLEMTLGIASKWLDSLDQIETRGLNVPFIGGC